MLTIVNIRVANKTSGPKFCQNVARAVVNIVPSSVPAQDSPTLNIFTSTSWSKIRTVNPSESNENE